MAEVASPWRRWGTVLALAAMLAWVVAVSMTWLDWHRNPGGVFQGPEGTHWQAVWETASSWFIPLWFVGAIVGGVLMTAGRRLRRR